MKSNIHKRMTYEDKFGRRYYCLGARRRMIRYQKKFNTKQTRRELKRELLDQNGLLTQ